MVKKQNTKIHLYVLGILITLFMAVLLLTTAFKDVRSEYEFVTDVEAKGESSIKLGEVKVRNNGFLPARIDLKNLQACSFDSKKINSRVTYNSFLTDKEIFLDHSYRYIEHMDMNANSEGTVAITLEYYLFSSKTNVRGAVEPQELPVNEEILDLYIFEVPEGTNSYLFCENVQKENALAKIKVNVLKEWN